MVELESPKAPRLPSYLSLTTGPLLAADPLATIPLKKPEASKDQPEQLFRHHLFIHTHKTGDEKLNQLLANYRIMGVDLWSTSSDTAGVKEQLLKIRQPGSRIIPVFFQCGLSSRPDQLNHRGLSFVEAVRAKFEEAKKNNPMLEGYELLFIAFSQPGFGESVLETSTPNNKIRKITTEDVDGPAAANLYEAVISALGIPVNSPEAQFIIAGHSAGAEAALDLITRHKWCGARVVLYNISVALSRDETKLFRWLRRLELAGTVAANATSILGLIDQRLDFGHKAKDRITFMIMRYLLGEYDLEEVLQRYLSFRLLGKLKEQSEAEKPQGAQTIPNKLIPQAGMHGGESAQSPALIAKLKALGERVVPIDRMLLEKMWQLPAFYVGGRDRITPSSSSWVKQFWQELFAMVGEQANITLEERQAILEQNTSPEGDNRFEEGHDSAFITPGGQDRAAQLMVDEIVRLVNPDPNDPILRMEAVLRQMQAQKQG